jgi:transcriptional regulator with XRE-family HTH domain
MESQGLTPSELADSIGIQRSNLTHVLKGRNNPSFPFIEKLLKKYPKLSAKWLIMGEGGMMEGKPVLPASLFDNSFENTENKTNQLTFAEEKKTQNTVSEPQKSTEKSENRLIKDQNIDTNQAKEKSIEKIIVFYADQTFKIYHPSE